MDNNEFISKLQNVADNYKTTYMWGVFGTPVTESVISTKASQYPSWYTAAKQTELRKLTGKGYFAFDCVCLIKGILWGWSGDASKSFGGAVYASNGVPDIGADTMISKCSEVSTDFSSVARGEALWIYGHIGIYIGGGKVIECTPAWNNCVQVTSCLNIGSIAGLNGRRWTKHGKLPYITYKEVEPPSVDTSFDVGDVVNFMGSLHYTGASNISGKPCKPGTAKVAIKAPGTIHPYHLIAEEDGGSTVYGWVDADKIQRITAAAPDAGQTPAQITVANGVADGVIMSPEYWTNVITGKTVASGANVKALIDKFHAVLTGMKGANAL